MGTLGREMAALPEVKGDVVMGDAGGLQEESAEVQAPVQAQSQPQQSTAGKKKKKGKK
jgi:UDP-N-acetylglucosamine 2-epimerase